MRELRDVYQAMTVTLILQMPTCAESGLLFACDADLFYQQKYIKEFYSFTPFEGLPPGKAASIDDVVRREELVRTDYYTKLLLPGRTEDILGMNIGFEPDKVALITISRSKDQPPFRQADRTLIESLAPHLSRALSIYVRVHDLMREREAFADSLDQLHIGAILLDGQGAFLHANKTGNIILAERNGLALQGTDLHTSAKEHDSRLKRVIADAVSAYRQRDLGYCEIVKLPVSETKFLHVLVRPSLTHAAIENSHAPSVCVFVSLPQIARMPSSDVIMEVFGLTRTESIVVSMLLAGLTPKEIAHELGSSLLTVRTHIKSTLAKIGAHRQSELVSTVLRSIAALA